VRTAQRRGRVRPEHSSIKLSIRIDSDTKIAFTQIAAMHELIQGKGQKSESINTLLLELTEGKVNHVLP
jgi:hypothetical protein